jgi:acetyl esterase/lipase
VLVVALCAAAPAAAQDAGALARWTAAPKATARFAAHWKRPPADFRRAWDAALATDMARLDSAAATLGDNDVVRRERERLRFRHAMGRVTYPYFSWREGAATSVRLDQSAVDAALKLPLADSSLWSLPEHRDLIGAVVHEVARDAMARDERLKRGDIRWLRAEYASAEQLGDSALVQRTRDALVLAHLDDNGSAGTDTLISLWRESLAAPEALARADSLIDLDRARGTGHRVVRYRETDGVGLNLHILRGEDPASGSAPAVLWFHGGSWTTGTWWHAPVISGELRSAGVTVIGVEFRTGSRFDAGPVEQLDDAIKAFEWVRANAGSLGIDSTRIGVAGFSSGATLALMLATRGLADVSRPLRPGVRRAYPAAVIAMGGCADPLAPGEDGYFKRAVSTVGPAEGFSPASLIARGQPPVLAIHGTEDEFCPFAATQAFVTRSASLGNDAVLARVAGAVHFFPFFDRSGQAEARRALGAALQRWGWTR